MGTNKLRRASGSVDQFYYDGNGNVIADSLNGTYNISYDHRNLIIQLYYKRYEEGAGPPVLRTYSEFYKFDDAGNRIKKVVMKYTGESQDPTIEDSGDAPPNWNYELIQHYVRDVGGNELAVYNDTTVTFWNVYGIDNAGKINYSDNSWNYYLKDHLGTPRVVIDQNGDIISAEDLDMWGYRMADRSFQSDTTFYKYTGKERDVTTGYDYFGARYYDSRIGRWGQVEPLLEKYLSWSPYNYVLNNPVRYFDPTGMWVAEYDENGNIVRVRYEEGDNFESLYSQLGMTAEDFTAFANKQGIDISGGPTGLSFDITELVLANTNFVSSFTSSNCHGFVCFATGSLNTEMQIAGQELLTTIGELQSVSSPTAGNIAVFDQSGHFGIPGETIDMTGVPSHSAIYLLMNQSGEAQYLNRINTGLAVTINTQSEIVKFFGGVTSRGSELGIIMPQFNPEPKFFRK